MTTIQYSLWDDEPMVEITVKGRRVAAPLAASPASTSTAAVPPETTSTASDAAATSGTVRRSSNPQRNNKTAKSMSSGARSAGIIPHDVPLGPEAQLAVSRIEPLQGVVRVALLEFLAVAAAQEAATQRALLPRGSAYPYTVHLNGDMIKAGVEGMLASPVLQQAIALNALFAAVPDEPIPQPSQEYLQYRVAEQARDVGPAAQPALSAQARASTPQTTQQPADQFGVEGGMLTWPEQIPRYGRPFKDGKQRPITPLVLLIGSRQRPYDLPKLALAAVQYATSQQIRVMFFDTAASERGITQDSCYCVPTPEHLARLVERYAVFGSALKNLEHTLRSIGTYAERLREACSIMDGTTAPTPAQLAKLAKANDGRKRLCDQVILASEPDKRIFVWNDPFRIPDVSRGPLFRHTPLCYQKDKGSATISQSDTFPCVDDETWERVQDAHAAAVSAQMEWLALLAELGTYKAAALDGRYAIILEQPEANMRRTRPTLFSVVDGITDEPIDSATNTSTLPVSHFDLGDLAEIDDSIPSKDP